MKSFAVLSSMAALLVGLSACSSVAQQQRSVGSFQMVKASGAINLYVRQGPTTKVEVDADQDVLESVKTEVRGNTLTIYRDKSFSLNGMLRSKTVRVYITTPQLAGIEVSGASDVKGETPISADDFRIQASGASDVTLTLNAKSLTTNASGASDIRLDGRVERQQVDISGSSDYRASDLRSRKANVQASGASDAYVYVDDELQAHSSGASDVHNKGRARVSR